MGSQGGLEDAMAKQRLRKVLKPFTGESEDGIPVLLGSSLSGKTSEKALVLEAVKTLAVLLSSACFAPFAFPLSFLRSVLFLSSFIVVTPGVSCFSSAQPFPQGQVTKSKHRVTGWRKRASLWIAPMLHPKETSSESLCSLACREMVLDTE